MNLRLAVLLVVAAVSPLAPAADACSAYKWDVSHEVRLFASAPAAVTAATEVGTAPLIGLDRHYTLTLHPQQSVRYVASPSKPMLADGAFGGVLRIKADRAGPHRIAIDAGFWLDVVHDGKPLQSLDFNGSRECNGPRKIVVYDLPAGTELVLQLAAATSASARLTVTPVAASVEP